MAPQPASSQFSVPNALHILQRGLGAPLLLLVMMAMSRSRGLSMMRVAMTPAALQPKPIVMLSACLPCAPARAKARSRLKATRGR